MIAQGTQFFEDGVLHQPEIICQKIWQIFGVPTRWEERIPDSTLTRNAVLTVHTGVP